MIKLLLLALMLSVSLNTFGDDIGASPACLPYTAPVPKTHSEPPTVPVEFRRGLLWQISKDNKVSYLLGTIHLTDERVHTLSESIVYHLKKSKHLILEVVPDQRSQEVFLEQMFFEDASLEDLLETEFSTTLIRQMRAYGFTPDITVKLKPWAAFTLLGRPVPKSHINQEANLFALANDHRLNISGIQTMQEIIHTLQGMDLEDQLTILRDTICNREKLLENIEQLVGYYLQYDLAAMVSFNHQPHHDEALFQRFMQRILYQRNELFFERIQTALSEGGAFIAVGALHLADGPNGLLMQLKEAGYHLIRVDVIPLDV